MTGVNDPRRRKQWQYMRDIGKPARCTETEREQAQARILFLGREIRMSDRQIATVSGVAATSISRVRDGGGITRRNYDKLMAVRPELPDLRGSVGSAVGVGRRVAALRAIGFPLRTLAVLTHASETRLRALSLGHGKVTHYEMTQRITAAYEKLHDADPVDYGVTPADILRCKAWAKTLAPPTAWDDDTIDDPEAIPEWTGACGSDEGYRIHIREDIPMCDPCRRLVELDGPSQRFSGTKLRIHMDQTGLDARQVAERAGVTVDSVRRWAWGQRRPQVRHIESLASVLDCAFNDLIEGEDVVQDHDFNRVKFAMTLEEKGLKYKALAARIGVSHMAVYYWLNGKNTPKIPKIVRAAEELGVDWKEFYQ
ncbi:helix-turn-helix transcriptional regulator [Streptomyces hydrogenans]|uniref:HTH cro/C1-type domain-containing protein n=1 Tax=Streptomyces hydrogenans TaxID=1873719 RepID=A0ABQ3PJF4_9ACTN|nr:helix-turn-helix transcriptional regulator [Streptomyces hydrogenans]GHF94607.1 hypothetical protein GCM10018784_02840 [Streptomyces hydrogenans]GHI25158.1 hypothetical protein Shyd_65290 [Streptomyces hydrogenans]